MGKLNERKKMILKKGRLIQGKNREYGNKRKGEEGRKGQEGRK